MNDETWKKLEDKYGVDAYTDSIVYIKLDVLLGLIDEAEKWEQIEPMMPEITRIILDAHKVAKLFALVTKQRSEEKTHK